MNSLPVYSWDVVYEMYNVYMDGENGNRNLFVKKMEEWNIPNHDAILIWQGFDMMAECHKIYEKNSIKE